MFAAKKAKPHRNGLEVKHPWRRNRFETFLAKSRSTFLASGSERRETSTPIKLTIPRDPYAPPNHSDLQFRTHPNPPSLVHQGDNLGTFLGDPWGF